MVDCDDVCASKWDIGVIRESLESPEGWDSLSFNRPGYYDIWALLYDEFIHHCWGFSNSIDVVHLMRKDFERKLAQSSDSTVEVLSAFCGFAIYKTSRFRGFRYDGRAASFYSLFTDQDRHTLESSLKCNYNLNVACLPPSQQNHDHGQACEHLFYHVTAGRLGRKVRVSTSMVCSGGAPRLPIVD